MQPQQNPVYISKYWTRTVRGINLDRSIHSWQVATFMGSGTQKVALQVSGKNGFHPGQIAPPIPAHRGHHRQASTWQMLLECLPTSVADPGVVGFERTPPAPVKGVDHTAETVLFRPESVTINKLL